MTSQNFGVDDFVTLRQMTVLKSVTKWEVGTKKNQNMLDVIFERTLFPETLESMRLSINDVIHVCLTLSPVCHFYVTWLRCI